MTTKILLADDEDGIRRVLGITLADMGYEVLAASDGRQAWEIFQEHEPPVVLTDIKMPRLDGIDLLRAVKNHQPDTEVIMITGHGDMDLAIMSLKHEATDFITKPINNDILEISLRRAEEKIAMRRQLREYTENLESLVAAKSARVVELERLLAVGQVVDSLTGAFKDIGRDLEASLGLRYFNEMPCLVAIHDRDLKIVATNELFRRRLGDAVGRRSWEMYDDRTLGEGNCPAAKTFDQGRGQRFQTVLAAAGKPRLPVIVHTAPVRNAEDEVELVLEISADIGEVNRLQEELRLTQEKFQRLFDEVPCYISVQDREFRLTAANRQFKEDFGDHQGALCHQVYKNRPEPCPRCPVALTFEDGLSHSAEMVVTAKGGRQADVIIHTAPILDAHGRITEVMEVSTDITEVRRLQSHLQNLGLLIGSVAHGIKGLLTGLDGGMYQLGSGLAKDDRVKVEEGYRLVELMVGRIRKLVLDLLDYAKERELHRERVDVLEFARHVSATIAPRAAANDIDFVEDFGPKLGEFEVDASAASAALVNILENAVEACQAGPRSEPPRVRFAVRREEEGLTFEVEDNGVGMDSETLEKLFNLFFSSKGREGTGLGLYIAQQVVSRHGGTIDVGSRPGRGSLFSVRLPRNAPPED